MSGSWRRLVPGGAGAGVVLACVLLAAQAVYVPDMTGKWRPIPPPNLPGGSVRAADADAVRLLERQVYALFQQVPILAVPKGFDVRPHSNFAVEDMDGHGDSPHPKVLTGAFNVQLGPYIVENGRTYAFFDIVIGWITVSLNTASCLDLSRMEAEDAGGEFYWRGPAT